MKRFMARARGRACRIRKRTSHATIVLREKFSMAKFAVTEKAGEPAKKTVKKAAATTKAAAPKKTTAAKAEKPATAKKTTKKTTKSDGGKE
jgi:hypothetical protein